MPDERDDPPTAEESEIRESCCLLARIGVGSGNGSGALARLASR